MMKTITVICFLILSICLAGQEGLVITGKVTNKTTGEPISYATIVFIGKVPVGTTSDIAGNYRLRIPDISAGERLQISCIGYNDTAIPVARLSSEIDFSLEPKVYSGPEVTVRPSRSTPFSIGPQSNTIALDHNGEPLAYVFSHHGINLGVYVMPSRQQVGSLITSIDYFIANRGPIDAPFLLRILLPDQQPKEAAHVKISDCYDILDQKIVFRSTKRGWNTLELKDYDIRLPDSPFFLLFIPVDEGEQSVWYENGEKRVGSVLGIFSTIRVRQMKWAVDARGRLAYLTELFPTIPAMIINCGDGL